ncbi:MAG: Asp-tRNA(Asn)/Glu-tRNA(Gln) amidotransferase subunit GatC [Gemmataceae bacterium]
MSLELDQVRWVAHLSRLELSEQELANLGGQLASIVKYVDQLRAVNTEGVEPMAHALDLVNVLREDLLVPSLPVTDALANAPARVGDHFSVPAVLD